VWTGHKIYTTIFGGAGVVLVGYALHHVWNGWGPIGAALLGGFLAFLLLAGIGFLYFFVLAPVQLDTQAQERIQLLAQANSASHESEYANLVQIKIIKSLDSCTLDGLRVIEYINGSGLVLEGELVEKFGAEALEDAKRSMLLRVRTTHVRSGTNDPIESNLYSFRDEYGAELKAILLSRQQV
jgi:hypothetical protein